MIVVDASVVANAIGDDGDDGGRARERLRRAGELAAPELVDVETLAVLRKRWLARDLTAKRFAAGLDDLEDLAMARFPTLPLLRRAYQLRANVSAYDAVHVALAEHLDCPLVTANGRLASASGVACEVELL